MTEDQREIRRKKRVIQYAEKIGHVGRACRRLGVGKNRSMRQEWHYEVIWISAEREARDAGVAASTRILCPQAGQRRASTSKTLCGRSARAVDR